MNKKLIIIPALLVAIGGGAALAQTDLLGFAEKNPTITASEAKDLALKEVNGQVIDFEYDGDDFTPHYEVEVVAEDEKVELNVNAQSGEVKIKEREVIANNAILDQAEVATANVEITQEQAVEIAQEKATGTVTSIELDTDDGRVVYEIEIRNGKTEYDFDIDATTGAVLKYEEDLED